MKHTLWEPEGYATRVMGTRKRCNTCYGNQTTVLHTRYGDQTDMQYMCYGDQRAM